MNKNLIVFLIYMISILLVSLYIYDYEAMEASFRFLGVEDLILIMTVNLFNVVLFFIFIPLGGGLLLPIVLMTTIVQYIKKSSFDVYIDLLTLLPHGIFEFMAIYVTFNYSQKFYARIFNNKINFQNIFNLSCTILYKYDFKIFLIKVIILLLTGAIVETYISNRIYYFFLEAV